MLAICLSVLWKDLKIVKQSTALKACTVLDIASFPRFNEILQLKGQFYLLFLENMIIFF